MAIYPSAITTSSNLGWGQAGGLGNWSSIMTSTNTYAAQQKPLPIVVDDVSMDEAGNVVVRSETYGIKLVVPSTMGRKLMALIQMAELAGLLPEEVQK